MSRTMQIDIRLIPFYEKPFKRMFPRFASLLRETGYSEPLERDVSLYDLVDYLLDILHEPGVSGDVKERIGSHGSRLAALKESAREQLLARRLNELDESLYRIEDAFTEMERVL